MPDGLLLLEVLVFARLAEDYYDGDGDAEMLFSKESITEDETGDVAEEFIQDFALWLKEGGHK